MSERVYVNRSGDRVWSPNTKEQLCEAVEHLTAECERLRRLVALAVSAAPGEQASLM